MHTQAIIKSWVINSVWSVPSHCWKEVFWRVLETFPPAGTEFNEQLHWIIIHTAQLSLFELRVNTLILYFLVRGRRPVLVETDSLKSQSCISSMRSVQLIRQGEQLNCVPLLDLYSNNDHHLPRRLRLSVCQCLICVVCEQCRHKEVSCTNTKKCWTDFCLQYSAPFLILVILTLTSVSLCLDIHPFHSLITLCWILPAFFIFLTFRNSIAASAVCAFNLSAISQAFNGPFKYQENSRSAWLPYPNPNPDFQVMKLYLSLFISQTNHKCLKNMFNLVPIMLSALLD